MHGHCSCCESVLCFNPNQSTVIDSTYTTRHALNNKLKLHKNRVHSDALQQFYVNSHYYLEIWNTGKLGHFQDRSRLNGHVSRTTSLGRLYVKILLHRQQSTSPVDCKIGEWWGRCRMWNSPKPPRAVYKSKQWYGISKHSLAPYNAYCLT